MKRTGWAFIEGGRGAVPSLNGWFSSSTTHQFGDQALGIILDLQPDFIAFEAPRDYIKMYRKKAGPLDVGGADGFTPNKDQLVLPFIAGMLQMACIGRRIPYEQVPAVTWRAAMIGGPNVARWTTAEAKMKAVNTCGYHGLQPGNHDVAEAMLIAMWALSCQSVEKLRHERQEAALKAMVG